MAIVSAHTQVQLAQAVFHGEGDGRFPHAASDPLAPMRGADREPELCPVAQAGLIGPHHGQNRDQPSADRALEHEAQVVGSEMAQKGHLCLQCQSAFARSRIEKI